jgi:hypothetical protein
MQKGEREIQDLTVELVDKVVTLLGSTRAVMDKQHKLIVEQNNVISVLEAKVTEQAENIIRLGAQLSHYIEAGEQP